MTLPNITIQGNTAGEAELRFTPSGKAVCSFRVVANKRKFDRDANEWRDDGRSPFLNVAVFGPQGEALAEALSGARSVPVIVTGQLKAREYTTQAGENRESLDIEFATVGIIPMAQQGGSQSGSAQRQAPVDPWATDNTPPF